MRLKKYSHTFLLMVLFSLVVFAPIFVVKAETVPESADATKTSEALTTDTATSDPNASAGSALTSGVDPNISTINVNSEGSANAVGPGEFLPISIRLVNFGSQKRIDVSIDYQILDKNDQVVYSESETVAVETTASFVKRIQLPRVLKSGTYKMVTTLHYPYQEQPAVSAFDFSVQYKIGGFFLTDLAIYFAFFLGVIMITIFITYLISGLKRRSSIGAYDYSDKPKNEIIYYEILSNIVSQMRLRIGDDAIVIAQDVPGLKVDQKTGKIVGIDHDPAKIIALLIFRYEKLLGQKISFSLLKH